MGSPSQHGLVNRRTTAFVLFAGAVAIFAPTVLKFEAVTTDLSAIRILSGDVLYRDIWTMYAPGGIYAMALAYSIFGVHMIVGNLLGIVVSALAVAALYRLGLTVTRPLPAASAAFIFTLAFLNSGYQNGLASYQPAILLLLVSAERLAAHAQSHRRQDLITAGLLLGLAAVFKHDVAGYAALASAAALLIVPAQDRRTAFRAVLVLAASALVVVVIPTLFLLAAGAGPAMLEDLFLYPLGYFRHVRPEYFPLLPPAPTSSIVETVRRSAWWGILTLPTLALLAGLPGIARGFRQAGTPAKRAVTLLLAAYPLFWFAAHVQANTHKVTMAGIGALVGAAGLSGFGLHRVPRGWLPRTAVFAAVAVWSALLLLEPLERLRRTGGKFERVDLPRLEGIVTTPRRADELRELSARIGAAAPPEAPLLLLGRRNDVLIYASAEPYWLSDRRMVTAHHELHPGVTDTEAIQRAMLDDISKGPMPVLVLEHRFDDPTLDRWGNIYRSHGVPVGSRLLDDWVREHYRSQLRIGRYEAMQLATE